MAQIEFQNVSFAYATMQNEKILDNVSFQIQQGQYVTICGRSGSGKSTLLRHCKTVLTPNGKMEGKIYMEGRELNTLSLREQTKKIGYVMQNPDNQIVTERVWHELAFGLESLGLENSIIRRKVAEIASFFGIQQWFYREVRNLSGGEKQLLNLASVMVMDPDILILDEPASQLDPIATSQLLNAVKRIHEELGVTVLISEHCLEEVLPSADLVLVLDEGRLVMAGEPRDVAKSLWYEWLSETEIKMYEALPVASQIFFESDGKGEVPLTVREGKQWIKHIFPTEIEGERQEKEYKDNRQVTKMLPALVVKDIWYRYDKCLPDVLRGTAFFVGEGELFAIVGGNGTGKSTMLKVISQLIIPNSGKVVLFGKDMTKRKNRQMLRDCIGVLPQDPLSLFVKGTVQEELEEMTEEKNEILEIVKRLELKKLLKIHPYDLSGGEQQRVALAKVLLRHPRLLLLDEPTKGMDIFYRKQLADILKELQKEGVTVIMISHDIEFCAKYVDRVAMFFDGMVITSESANDFFATNHFYTTVAHRICRGIWKEVVTKEQAVMQIHEFIRKRQERDN